MNSLINSFHKVIDWPLVSNNANNSNSKKSLKQSAELGAAFGAVSSGGLAITYGASAMLTAGIATSSVIIGYYAGSAAWKAFNHLRR